jgi:phenylacetate-CoA ligase
MGFKVPKKIVRLRFGFNEFRHRRRTLEFFEDLRRSQWLDPGAVRELQWEKLDRLLRHAYERVSFYRARFREKGITPKDIRSFEDLGKLDLLSKRDIIDAGSRILSEDATSRGLIPNSTGGSTGINLNFYLDKRNSEMSWGCILRNYEWAGIHLGDSEASLWAVEKPGNPMKRALVELKDRLRGQFFLSSYDLSDSSMRKYAGQLKGFRPDLLSGYPSTMERFARFLDERSIRPPAPRAIILSAETLFPDQRRTIESVFSAPIFNRYGSREFTTIAHECEQHHGLHVNCERVFVEILKDGRPAGPNELGEIVITDLDNYAMPFIRYRIGDMARLAAEPCACGRGLTLLRSVEGRTFDVVLTEDGRALGGTFWTRITRLMPGIVEFRVTQETRSGILLEIVPNDRFTDDSKEMLLRIIRRFCGTNFNVDLRVTSEIPRTPSGKRRFVVSKIAEETRNRGN